jgi:hypothetical protein
MTVRHLDGGAVNALNDLGSFKDNDQCLGPVAANYVHNYTRKQNISTSFNISNFSCNTCTTGEHQVLHRDGSKPNVRDLVPQAFVLSDQNFPAAIPAGGGRGLCQNSTH